MFGCIAGLPRCARLSQVRLLSKQMVEQQFQRLFAGDVLRVHMAYDTRSVDGLVHEYLRIRHKLLDALDTSRSHTGRRDAARKAVSSTLIMYSNPDLLVRAVKPVVLGTSYLEAVQQTSGRTAR